ncbi:MAG: hypothetical protein F6K14_26775 [Symploca sp. SIO2C1]|nr:hypothetical protein [Symploca sp. SIO2C1]
MTIKGLIKAVILCAKKKGQKLTITSVTDFCEFLGIKRRNFYQAKARLILEGFQIEISGNYKLTMWYEEETVTLPEEEKSTTVTSDTLVTQPDFFYPTCDQKVTPTITGCDQKIPTCDQKIPTCDQKVTPHLYIKPDLIPDLCPDRARGAEHTQKKATDLETKQEKPVNVDTVRVLENTGFPGKQNQETSLQQEAFPKDQYSGGACDNKTKKTKFLISKERLEELEENYEFGNDLAIASRHELQALANSVFPDRIKLYRLKTGKILGEHANDLDRGFIKFFAWKYWGNEQELKKASDTIRSYESDPSKWQTLCLAVDEWQEYLANPEKMLKESRQRASKGSELDEQITSKSDLTAFKRIAFQQEQAKKAREVAQKEQERGEVSKQDERGVDESHSPQSEDDFVQAPMPEEFKQQLEQMRKNIRTQKINRVVGEVSCIKFM